MRYLTLLFLAILINACSKVDHIDRDIYNNWFLKKESKGCFIYSFPTSTSGKYLNRDTNYIMINQNLEFAFFGGNIFNNNKLIEIQTDSSTVYITPFKDQAWHSADARIINLFLSNPNKDFLIFSYFENIEKQIIDRYSLIGFQKAFQEMQKECKVKKIETKEIVIIEESKS